MFELLPAIDLRGGRVVRLAQGDFARETAYGDDPDAVAERFVAAGAQWLHIVDLDGAREGGNRARTSIERIVATVGGRAACEVAGGLRDLRSIEAMFVVGAQRVVVGTAVLRNPSFAGELVTTFGPDRIVVALDVRDGVAVGGGWVPGADGVAPDEALDVLSDQGVAIFAVTAIDRDGMLAGPDLDLLGHMIGRGRGTIIASGGVSSATDIRAVRAIGCRGAIVGRALYEGRIRLEDAIEAAS